MEFSLQRIDNTVNINTLDFTKEYNSLSELYKIYILCGCKSNKQFLENVCEKNGTNSIPMSMATFMPI